MIISDMICGEHPQSSGSTPLNTVLERLSEVSKTGEEYVAHCPAHHDAGRGHLYVSEGNDGRVLLHCKKDCTAQEIVDAIELSLHDLFAPGPTENGHKEPLPTSGKQRHEIREPDGTLAAIHCRKPTPTPDDPKSKRMWFEGPDGTKGLSGRPTVDLPLFGCHRLTGRGAVVITEGEPAADALIQAGIPAVGTVTGASSAPSREALERCLAGHETIILWPDNDGAGRAHMRKTGAILRGIGKTVTVFTWTDAPFKGDAADHPAIIGGDKAQVAALKAALKAAPAYEEAGAVGARIEVRCAANVQPEKVTWLWDKRIPYGKVTIWDGDPDQGKSVVSIAVASTVTTGRAFPDGAACEAGNVLIVNVEDGEADTIVPRLEANGADLQRAFMFSSVPDDKGGSRLLSLPEDTPLLEQLIAERGIKLVIIDPVMTMLGADANKDQDARKALAPLKETAERTGAAIVCIRHLNKTVGLKAIQRGGGNMGLIGVARAGAFFATHPDDDELRVIAQHKSNLAPKPPSLAYQIVTSAINGAPRIEWKGTVEHNADTLASGPQSPEDRSQLDAAKEFLMDELGDGPVIAKQVLKDAQEAGVARATLYRAKDALRVKSSKDGLGPWVWSLPDKPDRTPKKSEDTPHENLEYLENLENLQGTLPHTNGSKTPYFVEDTQDTQDDQDTHVSKNGRVPCESSIETVDGNDPLSVFLDDPPAWFLCQIAASAKQGHPNRLLKPLVNSVATEVLGTATRADEVRDRVLAWVRGDEGGAA